MRVSREVQRRHGYSFDDRERATEHPFVQVFRPDEGWNWST
jgi:hypothetical protein